MTTYLWHVFRDGEHVGNVETRVKNEWAGLMVARAEFGVPGVTVERADVLPEATGCIEDDCEYEERS